MECAIDRLPVDGRFTRECDEETSREGVVFPDLIDMKFPNRSSSKKKHTNYSIQIKSLIAQGLQRDRDKEVKKQEKKERRRRAQKATGGPKDLQVNEETRINV